LLGLETGEPITHDRLRRAYLRRLRAHPPERDPEGFRQLREAFEALEPLARMHDYVRAAAVERAQSCAAADADEPERSGVSPDEDNDEASAPAGPIVVELANGELVELRPAPRTRPPGWSWPASVRTDAAGPGTASAAGPATAGVDRHGHLNGRGEAPTDQSSEVVRTSKAGDTEAARASKAGETEAARASKAGASDAARAADRESPDADELPDDSPYRRSGRPIDEPIMDPPTTLREVTDEILALLQAGSLDAALDIADRWSRSTLDDHREVSPNDAQCWALTRELLDVAPAAPESLRRAIARGIAAGDLTTARSAAETFRARHPAQANDLSRHFAKRATSLHKVLGQPLQGAPVLGETLERSTRSSRAPIWIAVLLLSALVRAAGSCEHSRTPSFDYTPRPQLQIDQTPGQRWQLDSRPLQDDQAPRHNSWLNRRLDLPDLSGVPRNGKPGAKPQLEMRPDGQTPPSRP
jgi:hypothetical protein